MRRKSAIRLGALGVAAGAAVSLLAATGAAAGAQAHKPRSATSGCEFVIVQDNDNDQSNGIYVCNALSSPPPGYGWLFINRADHPGIYNSDTVDASIIRVISPPK